MRKIKYKKVRKVQPNNLEYTGIHKKTDSEMQLFVYDNTTFSEFNNVQISKLEESIDEQKTNRPNTHG